MRLNTPRDPSGADRGITPSGRKVCASDDVLHDAASYVHAATGGEGAQPPLFVSPGPGRGRGHGEGGEGEGSGKWVLVQYLVCDNS